MPVAGGNKPAALIQLDNGVVHIIDATMAPVSKICTDLDEAVRRLKNGEKFYVTRIGSFIGDLGKTDFGGDITMLKRYRTKIEYIEAIQVTAANEKALSDLPETTTLVATGQGSEYTPGAIVMVIVKHHTGQKLKADPTDWIFYKVDEAGNQIGVGVCTDQEFKRNFQPDDDDDE